MPSTLDHPRLSTLDETETTMALDPALLDILACPQDKGPLYYIEAESLLYNPRLHRRYEVRDGIPVMLIPESTEVDDAEHERLMSVVESNGIAPTFETDSSLS
jgi:uncharacterized protein YbaR (Trm112 family)